MNKILSIILTNMKFYFILLLCFFVCSCENKTVIECTYLKSTECYFQKNDVTYFFEDKKLSKLTNNTDLYTVVFSENIDSITSIHIANREDELLKEIYFDAMGIKTYRIYNNELGELIEITLDKRGTTVKVFYVLEKFDIYKISQYYTVTNLGNTTNYFHLLKNEKGFFIKTDESYLDLKNPQINRVELTYFDNRQNELDFVKPDSKTDYMVVYEDDDHPNEVVNSLQINTQSDSLVGYIWTIFNKGISPPYRYHFFIHKDGIAKRINKCFNQFKYDNNEFNRVSSLSKQVKNDILKSGIYVFKNDRFMLKNIEFN